MRFLPVDIYPKDILTTIGLISDTHMPLRWPQLPPALPQIFEGVDLILHAGDVGDLWVLDALSRIAPVTAVHGNDDTPEATRELPMQQLITVGGQRLLLWHSHYPDRVDEMHDRVHGSSYRQKLARIGQRGQRAGAVVVVFGHWHIPQVYRHEEVLLVNPGAIASGTAWSRQLVQTVALLFVLKNGRFAITHVDINQPDAIFQPEIDFDADFVTNIAGYNQSILAADMQAMKRRFVDEVLPLSPQLWAVWHELAHRCWSGELPKIAVADVKTAVAQAPIYAPLREQILHKLSTL